jgi:hypothetical protein
VVEAGDLVDRAAAVLGDEQEPQRLTDTIVAAGVLHADPALLQSADHGAPELRAGLQGALGERVSATFLWSDPGDWMLAHPDTCAWLADWWTLGSHVVDGPPARLAVTGTDRLDAVAGIVGLLATGSGVGSTVIARPGALSRRPPPRWTWPLRVLGGFPSGRDDDVADSARVRLRRYAPWWDDLVTQAPGNGPWARASLGLFSLADDAASAESARLAPASRTASADAPSVGVAVGLATRRPLPRFGSLARIADTYGAAVMAAVDPGADPERWLAELVAALAGDEPVDFAIHTACRVCGGAQAPLIAADLGYLDTTRLRNVLARSLQAHPDGPPLHRLLRGAPTSGLEIASDFTDPDDGAVRAARYLARQRRADQRDPVRVLKARLIGDDEAITILRPLHRYRMEVWVGAAGKRATNRTPPFPSDLLPPQDAAELLVVVSGLPAETGTPLPGIAQGPIILPAFGDSTRAQFTLTTGQPGTNLDLAVIVLYRNRFLQAGRLRGQVGGPGSVSFTVEAVIRADLDDINIVGDHDLALISDRDAGGGELVTAIVQGTAEIFGAAVGNIARELAVLLARPVDEPDKFGTYESQDYQRLLVDLARVGRALFDGMFSRRVGSVPVQWEGGLRSAARISVLSARPDAVLPLEFVYDRALEIGPLSGSAGQVCPQAPAVADAHACALTCPLSTSKSTVCPFGFWGASKVIERHLGREETTRSDPAVATFFSPSFERHSVGLDVILAAAAARADHNDARAWTSAIKALPPQTRLAAKWRELADQVRVLRNSERVPDVLVLVTHSRRRDGLAVLEIGEGDELSVIDSLVPLVDPDAASNPIVMLLGCGTAGEGVPMLEAPMRFLQGGAPGVIATMGAVRGRTIVPVAVRLLEELRESAKTGQRLGDAMRRIRQQGLVSGVVTGLNLVAFGDSDWDLRASDALAQDVAE